MAPDRAVLAVQLPIGFGNVIRPEDAALLLQSIARRKVFGDPRRIYGTVNDGGGKARALGFAPVL